MKSCNEKPCGIQLFHAQIDLSAELLKLLGAGAAKALSGLSSWKLPRMQSCCDIPEPCWMPLCLGDARCSLAPGGEGVMRLVITNQDYRSRSFLAKAAGAGAAFITLSTAQVTLGPKESATITAVFTAPLTLGVEYEVLLWVRGSRDHYARWKIAVGSRSHGCCYEAEVNDQPDYVVHWYDHFYCMKSQPKPALPNGKR